MVTWGLIGRNELALISLHGYTPAGVGARLDFFAAGILLRSNIWQAWYLPSRAPGTN